MFWVLEHSGTPNDRDTFNLLLDDVRDALDKLSEETGKYYGLTAALPCGPNHMAVSYTIDLPTNSDLSFHIIRSNFNLSHFSCFLNNMHRTWTSHTSTPDLVSNC